MLFVLVALHSIQGGILHCYRGSSQAVQGLAPVTGRNRRRRGFACDRAGFSFTAEHIPFAMHSNTVTTFVTRILLFVRSGARHPSADMMLDHG